MGTISIGRFGEYAGESDTPVTLVSLLMLALMRAIVLLVFCVVVGLVAGLGVVFARVVLATATFVRLFAVVIVVGFFLVVEVIVRLIALGASKEFDTFVLMKTVFGIFAIIDVAFVGVVVFGAICVILVIFIVVGGAVVVFGAICVGVDFVVLVVVAVVDVDVVGIAVISLDGVAMVVAAVPLLLISFELLADGADSDVSFCFVVASNGCTIVVCCTSGITVGDTGSSIVSVKRKQTTTCFKLDPIHAGWRSLT